MFQKNDNTIKFIQKIHFQPKKIKHALGYIPSFNANIIEIKKTNNVRIPVEK